MQRVFHSSLVIASEYAFNGSHKLGDSNGFFSTLLPEIGPQFPTSDAKVFHVDEAKIWLLWQLDRFAGDMLTASPGHPSYYIAGALSNIQWSFTHSIGTSILHSTVVKETTLLSPCFILLGPPSHRWTHNAWCLCLFMTSPLNGNNQ